MKRFISFTLLILVVAMPFVAFAQDAAPVADQSFLSKFWWQTIFPALMSAVTGLVLWLGKVAGDYFKKKAAEADASVASQLFNSNMEKLVTLLGALVSDANVSIKPLVAKALEDGKVTAEEGAEIKKQVLALFIEKAPKDLLEFAKGLGGGLFDKLLGGLVEKFVASNKSAPSLVVNTDASPS